MIKSIKTKYLLKYINKVAPGHQREKQSRNLRDIEHIGMVLDGSDPECIAWATGYAESAREEGKKVDLLAYLPKREKMVSYPLPVFTKEDMNWYYRPVAGHIREFMGRSYDLLINLSPDKVLPLEYICALSASRFIIGNGTHHLNTYYDCLIKVNDSYSPARFMENARHYLNLQA